MAQVYGTFSKQMKTSGKLHEMLNQPNLTPERLFEVPNIAGDISQNIQTFLRFCLKNRQFTTQLIKICFNSSYQDLQSDDAKRVAQHAIEILTNDQNALCAFLFSNEQDTWGLTKPQKAQQQAMSSIESEAERLFSDNSSPKVQEANWEGEKDAFQQYELIKMTLAHLEEQHKNQTCLGYIHKLYEAVMKKSSDQFLQFLQQKPYYLTLFLKHLNYIAIGAIIVLMLACEDRTSKYQHEELKKNLFSKIIDYSFQNIEDSQNFETYMMVVEEILNTTKQSYYEYFEDFKRCANILVSESTLRRYYQVLMSKSEIAFGNGSRYLQHIIKRINSESQEHDYYRQSQNAQPTMNFQHAFFYNQFHNLLDLIGKSQGYSSMNRVGYLGFLMSLLKNMQNKGKEPNLPNVDIFKKLIQYYQKEKVGGLVKNYLFQLLKYISKKFKENQAHQIAQWLIDAKVEHELLSKLFDDGSTTNNLTNSSSTVCFILSILFDIQNKQNTFLNNYAKTTNVQLSYAYEKYRTKLANYGQEDDNASPLFDDPYLSFKMASKGGIDAFLGSGFQHSEEKIPEKQQKQPEVQLVGKNSVMIPTLNLPNKTETTKVNLQEAPAEQAKSSSQLSRQALIKDLKNTRIELPQRLKAKKAQQQQRKTEIKNQKQIILQTQLPKQKIDNKILPAQDVKVESQETKFDSKPTTSPLPTAYEQKYFIRHFLLF